LVLADAISMSRIRWIVRKGGPDTWLGRVMGHKPRMVAAIALANKMADHLGYDDGGTELQDSVICGSLWRATGSDRSLSPGAR